MPWCGIILCISRLASIRILDLCCQSSQVPLAKMSGAVAFGLECFVEREFLLFHMTGVGKIDSISKRDADRLPHCHGSENTQVPLRKSG